MSDAVDRTASLTSRFAKPALAILVDVGRVRWHLSATVCWSGSRVSCTNLRTVPSAVSEDQDLLTFDDI